MKERTKMKTTCLAMLTSSLVLILSSSASAVVYWEENFDSYGEQTPLNGQAGPNGQTWALEWDLWADPQIGSMAATSVGGQNGTLGAGRWDLDDTDDGPPPTGGKANQGSHIPMGVKVTDGMLYVDFDLHVGTGRISGPQWTFIDTDYNRGVGVAPDWINNANGGFDPQTGLVLDDDNNIFWGDGSAEDDITELTNDIHGSWVFDLDNKTVTFSFTSKQEPDKVATLSAGYSRDWQPDKIAIYNHAMGTIAGMGYDNFCIASGPDECASLIPPPAPIDFAWTSSDSGNWQVASNWGTSAPPGDQTAEQSSYHTATFGDEIGSESRTVYTDTAVTLNSISFNNTMGGSYRIVGGPSINVNAATGGVAPSLTVDAGSHEFQVEFGIHANTTANIASGASLSFVNRLHLNGHTLTKTGDGTLLVNDSFNTGSGTVINNGGVIAGGGSIGGDVRNDGGTISPGNLSQSTDQVPEPATLTTILVGIAAMLALARHRKHHVFIDSVI